MTRAWSRGFSQNATGPYSSGYVDLLLLNPGQTILRMYWTLNAWHQESLSGYPPGTTVFRAGIILADSGGGAPPGPITSPNADWMDIETVWPEQHVTESTNIDWWFFYKVGNPDKSIKAQRKNTGTTSLGLFAVWEMSGDIDTSASFLMDGWSAGMDVYINTP